jgi:OOP family OmpA-OmpF porin
MMSLPARFCAALLALSPLAAAAVETPFYEVPYLGGSLAGMSPDSVRNASVAGGGYHAFGGWPLRDHPQGSVELRLLDYQMKRKKDGKPNFQTSLFADYVYDFGSSIQGAAGFFRGTKFFVNAGLGAMREDSYGNPGTYLGLDAGGGLLVPLGFKGWAVRLDGRAQLEKNSSLCNSANVSSGKCTKEASYLLDYVFSAGLQIPLTIFFDKPVALSQQEECPIAVVDPSTGRRDCGAKGVDSDGDGAPDSADRCPSTAAGFRVDADGCALAQEFDLSAPQVFAGSSATLTPEGKGQLVDIGRMIAAQANAVAVIDAQGGTSGSAAFNMMLSEQRMAAVRQGLLDDGVKPEQIADDVTEATGRGKLVLRLVVRP